MKGDTSRPKCTMTRVHFKLVADAIRRGGTDADTITESIANALATTNPCFDRVKFIAACQGGTD